MGSRYEWLLAVSEPAEILVKGDQVRSYDEPVSEPLAIKFGVEDGAIIEGTHDELMAMCDRVITGLNAKKKF